jgi:hypothetical protein
MPIQAANQSKPRQSEPRPSGSGESPKIATTPSQSAARNADRGSQRRPRTARVSALPLTLHSYSIFKDQSRSTCSPRHRFLCLKPAGVTFNGDPRSSGNTLGNLFAWNPNSANMMQVSSQAADVGQTASWRAHLSMERKCSTRFNIHYSAHTNKCKAHFWTSEITIPWHLVSGHSRRTYSRHLRIPSAT